MTTFAGINYIAVVLAAAASFLFGGVWYGILSKPWLAATGKTEEEIKIKSKGRRGMAAPLAITAVCQLVMAYMLAGIIGHLGADQVTFFNGVISAFFIWLGFVATTLIVNHAFQGVSRQLTLIDGGHWLGVLLIQGTVIGLIGVS